MKHEDFTKYQRRLLEAAAKNSIRTLTFELTRKRVEPLDTDTREKLFFARSEYLKILEILRR